MQKSVQELKTEDSGQNGTLRRLLERAFPYLPGQRPHRAAGQAALLEKVLDDLAALNRSTEQDFLKIGAKLGEFAGAARQISSDMTALNALISGCEGCNASDVLAAVLERSKEMETRAASGDGALAQVCDATRQIASTFRGFKDTVAVFRVLSSLTRIETARLGSTGAEFGNLAEEVNALTKNVESSGQDILEISSAIQHNMQSALGTVSDLRASELQELPSLVEGIKTSLSSFAERRERAIETSLRQAQEYHEVSAAIGDLVTAIQFQDITRQQVEHVAEALRKLRPAVEGAARNGSQDRLNAALALQSSQLANAAQIFASSVGRIERDLDSIAGRVREMAESGKSLLGVSTDDHDSFFVEMQGRFTAILNLAGKCDRAEAETEAALRGLEQGVERLRASLEGVSQVEIRIRRIAINATIRAVQIGDAGNALSVLAEVMHRLGMDSGGATEQAGEALEAIAGAAGQLSARAEDGPAARDVSSAMRNTIEQLHLSNETSSTRIRQIATHSSRLSGEIQSVRAGFSAGEIFAETIRNARKTLAEMAGASGIESLAESVGEHHLDDFAQHYTMHAERQVHELVATGGAVESGAVDIAAPAESSQDTAGEEDLGSNVELF